MLLALSCRIDKNNLLNCRIDNVIYESLSVYIIADSSTATYEIANHRLLVFFIDQKSACHY